VDALLPVLVPAIVSLIVVGAGYLANRRLGIAPGQQQLVITLRGLVDAQGERIDMMAKEFGECKTRLERIETLKEDLEQEVDDLRTELRSLRRAPRRT
jgi:septal ring factor EnvC (AmiA/AmiB activator)